MKAERFNFFCWSDYSVNKFFCKFCSWFNLFWEHRPVLWDFAKPAFFSFLGDEKILGKILYQQVPTDVNNCPLSFRVVVVLVVVVVVIYCSSCSWNCLSLLGIHFLSSPPPSAKKRGMKRRIRNESCSVCVGTNILLWCNEQHSPNYGFSENMESFFLFCFVETELVSGKNTMLYNQFSSKSIVSFLIFLFFYLLVPFFSIHIIIKRLKK